MAEIIKISDLTPEGKKIVCTHCKARIPLDLTPFVPDPTNILRDRCPKCNGEICVAVLVLAHKDIHQLAVAIQSVIDTLNTGNLITS